jgi:hypothetical protein
MTVLFYDSDMADDARREQVYRGQLFVYSPRPEALAVCAFARDLTEAAFAPLDPRTAQHELPVARFAAILAELKPRFIHHPRSKHLIQQLLLGLGCNPAETYFDVPRLRTSTSDGYLDTGISYAFHPHRDTWYSAPQCQINWWLPVYDVVPENIMAFHPLYWDRGVRNGSRDYNYAEWNRTGRVTASQQIGQDTRNQPKPEEPLDGDRRLCVVSPAGSVIVFSGAQLHSTVSNTSGVTRFSVDFRTVHIRDVNARLGAPNVDSECTGTTMGDYLRVTDLAHVPDELIREYDTPKRSQAVEQ